MSRHPPTADLPPTLDALASASYLYQCASPTSWHVVMPLTGRRTADPSLKTDNHRFSTFMPNTRHSEYLPRSSPSLDGIALSDAVLGRQSESALSATTSTPAPAPGRGLLRNPSDIKSKRFSLMRFRHASDPQLSKSYADSAIPPVPPVPPRKCPEYDAGLISQH